MTRVGNCVSEIAPNRIGADHFLRFSNPIASQQLDFIAVSFLCFFFLLLLLLRNSSTRALHEKFRRASLNTIRQQNETASSDRKWRPKKAPTSQWVRAKGAPPSFFSSLFPGFNAALTNDFPRRFTQEHDMKNSKELNLPASFVKEP